LNVAPTFRSAKAGLKASATLKVAGSLLVYLISDTFTRPLANAPYHAKEIGDYYDLTPAFVGAFVIERMLSVPDLN